MVKAPVLQADGLEQLEDPRPGLAAGGPDHVAGETHVPLAGSVIAQLDVLEDHPAGATPRR